MIRPGDHSGFTLIEALLSIVILALIASVAGGVYMSGTQSLQIQSNRMLLDSAMRSKMEELVSTTFDTLSNGSDVVAVGGVNYTRTWSVSAIDLNGDSTPEIDVKQIMVTLDGRTVRTLMLKSEGDFGKI